MSKKLTPVLAGAAIAASLGVWGSSQARGDLNLVMKDMTYGLSSGSISVTATSVTLGLYATFSGVTVGGLNLTRGYFGATGSVDALGNISNPAVGSLFSVPGGTTAQIGVSANLNGDGVTDWGDQPANNGSGNGNFFFVDAAAHPRPANASGVGVNSSGTALVSVLVGTIRLNMASIGASGSVNVGYGLSTAVPGGDPTESKTIWAENYSLSLDPSNNVTGVSNVKNEISNLASIHFVPFTLTFAIPTWSGTAAGSDWGVNGNNALTGGPTPPAGTNWATKQTPDGPGFPVVFANTVATGSATVSSPHTVGAITFTGTNTHNFVQTSYTGTIGTATAIVTTSGAITLNAGNLANAIVTSNSSVAQNLLVPMKLVSTSTIISTTGAGKLNLGPVTISVNNTLTIPVNSKVTMTALNQNDGGRGALDVEGSLQLINDTVTPGISNPLNRQTVKNVTILDSLTVGASGLLNIGNHDLIIRNAGAGALTTVRNLLLSGYGANQDWSGTTGITTSGPENATGLGAIGYALTSDLVADFGFNGVFDGVGVNANDILLKYTWTGDTDLNGVVDTNDYGDVDTGFSSGLKGWIFGDLDYNNTVDTNDYGLIDVGFSGSNHVLANDGGLSPTAVPEPASLGLLGLAAGGMLLRRNKRSK